MNSMRSSASSKRKAALDSGKFKSRFAKQATQAEWLQHKLYLFIQARIYSEEKYKTEFVDHSKFRTDLPEVHYPKSIELVDDKDLQSEQKDVLKDIVTTMIKEIVHHPDVYRAMDEAESLKAPFFAQFVQTSAHRIAKETPINLRQEKEFFNSNEVQQLFESILEETIFNLMNEVRTGEFDLLKIPTLVAKTTGFMPKNIAFRHDKYASKHVKFDSN